MKDIKLFSFFSGSGFLDYGFEQAGFKPVYVNESHLPFLNAYKYARHQLKMEVPEYGYFHGDIKELLAGPNKQRLIDQVNAVKTSGILTGFIGGPPCPDFSVAGKNKGKHGENGKLSALYAKLIRDQKPDFFLFENVKGLWRTKLHREFYEELKRGLQRAGYYTTERVVNSIEYGVPQDRDRIILLGFHKSLDIKSVVGKRHKGKTLPEGAFGWVDHAIYPGRLAFSNYIWPATNAFCEGSVLTAPEKIPIELTVEHWFKRNNVENHPNAGNVFAPRAALSKFKSIAEGDDSEKSFKRLHRWRYSPTAAYGNNEVHLHPYKARRISAAEAIAIQSLPENFSLPPEMSLSDMFKTIGNGVPFLAARGIALSVKSFLEGVCMADFNQFENVYEERSHNKAVPSSHFG